MCYVIYRIHIILSLKLKAFTAKYQQIESNYLLHYLLHCQVDAIQDKLYYKTFLYLHFNDTIDN